MFSVLISLANILVCCSLFPSIRSEQKPHIKTCLMNVVVSLFFIVAFSLTQQWVVVTWNILIGGLWAYLAHQVKNRRKEEGGDLAFKIIDEKVDSLESYD